jgi:hypothetical protein
MRHSLTLKAKTQNSSSLLLQWKRLVLVHELCNDDSVFLRMVLCGLAAVVFLFFPGALRTLGLRKVPVLYAIIVITVADGTE